MPIEILSLTPLIPSGEKELHRRYDVCRWYDLPDREAWLDQNGASIRAVVTGGHLGITNEMMQRLPALGIVAVAGVGYDRIDLAAARARGVRVTNTPDVLTEDVADFAIGLMIATLRRIAAADRYLREGCWKSGEMDLATRVCGRRYGIVGLGKSARPSRVAWRDSAARSPIPISRQRRSLMRSIRRRPIWRARPMF